MDNKLDTNVTEKKVSDENMLKTVEEALMKNELCLFMSETGTFMTTGTTDDAEEIFLKLQSVLLAGFLSMEKATDYDIEQILLLQLEAVKEIKKELSGVTPPKGSILLKGERDIIKLAAQLYVYDALKKKITILTNIQKGKDINVDIFLPKVTDVTVSDFAKHLQKAIESQPEEERAKHRKFFGEPISFCRCVARGNLMASVLVEEFNSEVKKIKENYEV